MPAYYISPHYDDAIGSCGGKIYMDYLNNENPTIITIFSKAKEPFSNYAKDLHSYWNLNNPLSDRKKENTNACQIIHAKEQSLQYEDAIYRIHNGEYLYPGNGDIFKQIHHKDESLHIKIAKDIKKIVNKEDKLYFPLGIGNHVDHIIANLVGNNLKAEGYNITYYIDFSYEGHVLSKYKKKETIILDNKIIKQKSLAMSEYTSQVKMLFESRNKIFDYYKIKLKGREEYYE